MTVKFSLRFTTALLLTTTFLNIESVKAIKEGEDGLPDLVSSLRKKYAEKEPDGRDQLHRDISSLRKTPFTSHELSKISLILRWIAAEEYPEVLQATRLILGKSEKEVTCGILENIFRGFYFVKKGEREEAAQALLFLLDIDTDSLNICLILQALGKVKPNEKMEVAETIDPTARASIVAPNFIKGISNAPRGKKKEALEAAQTYAKKLPKKTQPFIIESYRWIPSGQEDEIVEAVLHLTNESSETYYTRQVVKYMAKHVSQGERKEFAEAAQPFTTNYSKIKGALDIMLILKALSKARKGEWKSVALATERFVEKNYEPRDIAEVIEKIAKLPSEKILEITSLSSSPAPAAQPVEKDGKDGPSQSVPPSAKEVTTFAPKGHTVEQKNGKPTMIISTIKTGFSVQAPLDGFSRIWFHGHEIPDADKKKVDHQKGPYTLKKGQKFEASFNVENLDLKGGSLFFALVSARQTQLMVSPIYSNGKLIFSYPVTEEILSFTPVFLAKGASFNLTNIEMRILEGNL